MSGNCNNLSDRSPLWCAVGWQDGDVLRFSHPEILLYNDQDVTKSAEGNRFCVHAPFLFETDGRLFVAYSNKKTKLQISEVPQDLLNGLANQRKVRSVYTERLKVCVGVHRSSDVIEDIDQAITGATLIKSQDGSVAAFINEESRYILFDDTNAPLKVELGETFKRFKKLKDGGSFAIEAQVAFDGLEAGQTIIDLRNEKGQGVFWIGLGNEGKVEAQLIDETDRCIFVSSAPLSFEPKDWVHFVVNVDGLSFLSQTDRKLLFGGGADREGGYNYPFIESSVFGQQQSAHPGKERDQGYAT